MIPAWPAKQDCGGSGPSPKLHNQWHRACSQSFHIIYFFSYHPLSSYLWPFGILDSHLPKWEKINMKQCFCYNNIVWLVIRQMHILPYLQSRFATLRGTAGEVRQSFRIIIDLWNADISSCIENGCFGWWDLWHYALLRFLLSPNPTILRFHPQNRQEFFNLKWATDSWARFTGSTTVSHS